MELSIHFCNSADVVGHTEMMQGLGDAKDRDVLREDERITRETLKAHGGAEVIADTVRGLCSRQGLSLCGPRGVRGKGSEEPVRVSEVRWQK